MTKEVLLTQLKSTFSNKPHHAYLITCSNLNYATNVLDLFLEDYSESDILKIIKTDVIKKEDSLKIIDHFNLKSFNLAKRFLVLGDFANITPEAENALLKFIEEPPAQTYIFLLSANKEAILPTILSRTLHFDLGFDTDAYFLELKEEFDDLTSFILSLTTTSSVEARTYFESPDFQLLKESITDFFNLDSKESAVLFYLKYQELLDFSFFHLLLPLYSSMFRKPFLNSRRNINALFNEYSILKELSLKANLNIKFKNVFFEFLTTIF